MSTTASLRALLALALAALLAACAGAQPPEQTVRGVLLDVRASSISKVDSLRLRADDGREWSFSGGSGLDGDPEGTPGHLRGHMARVDEVVVHYHDAGGTLVADRVQDT